MAPSGCAAHVIATAIAVRSVGSVHALKAAVQLAVVTSTAGGVVQIIVITIGNIGGDVASA